MANERISLPGEIWKPVPTREDSYEVSNYGRVWSILRQGGRKTGRLLRSSTTPKGYKKIRLQKGARPQNWYIHSLVLIAFVRPRCDGEEAAHLNGDPADNRLANLRWVSSKENKRHQRLHGTQPFGANHHSAVLTIEQVSQIKRLRDEGMFWREIAALFGVATNTARRAGRGQTYRPDLTTPVPPQNYVRQSPKKRRTASHPLSV
jgi:hypothetical protein